MKKEIYFIRILPLFILMVLSATTINCIAQKSDKLQVLKQGKIGKVYYFNHSTKQNGTNKSYITYIGMISTNTGTKLKILTYKNIWGPNLHTTGIIFLYDSVNKFVAKYVLGASEDLPQKIEENKLVFSNVSKNNCDHKITTKIDFGLGVPNEIFIKCKEEKGDIYLISYKE